MNAPLVPRPAFRCCLLVPTYDNPITLRAVVEQARQYLPDVVVIDDGSGPPGRRACEALATDGLAIVHHRERNGGKGAAVKTGFRIAREHGFTHVLQIDADGQHDQEAIPLFLERGRAQPGALVIGHPEYDDSVPTVRRVARKFTHFWVDLEAGRGTVLDSMIGFRVYPLHVVKPLRVAGDRMDFDIEIAVRIAWSGAPIINEPVKVRYLPAEQGGVSHFQMFWDNARFTWLHTRLCTLKCIHWVLARIGRG
jgi:glycosyltransferase involved in cell wall biosynthesis